MNYLSDLRTEFQELLKSFLGKMMVDAVKKDIVFSLGNLFNKHYLDDFQYGVEFSTYSLTINGIRNIDKIVLTYLVDGIE